MPMKWITSRVWLFVECLAMKICSLNLWTDNRQSCDGTWKNLCNRKMSHGIITKSISCWNEKAKYIT